MQDRFINRDALTEKIEFAIKSEEKRRNISKNNELFLTNQLTNCTRKTLYRVYGEEYDIDMAEELHQQSVKHKWLDFIEQSRIAKLIDKNIEAADTKYNLASRVDGVFRIGELTFTVLIKSVHNEEFQRIKERSAPRRDIVQLMMDMWLTEVKDGLLLYDNRETNDILTYHVLPYQPIINAACGRCLEMRDHKLMGKLTKRPYDSSDSEECLACKFKATCWKQE